MVEQGSDTTPARAPRRRMGAVTRRVVTTLLVLGSLAGLVVTVSLAQTGSDAAGNLPDSVEQVMPVAGAEVPRQSLIGIDVATGHDAYLVINGIEVRSTDDGLIKDLGTGLIQFQPGPGTPVDSLEPGRNCVVANVWDRIVGEESTSAVSWCFDAY
ncbi:MAG TPA: hypothetical protein VKZ55_08035 [Microthrixaceae bacterium]|nr:hypothetical protein [Microthrixaceae bacterium]